MRWLADSCIAMRAKATLCDPEIPDNRHHALLLHSLQDPTFPHTPTVHQYLSRPQVQAYIKLGQISAETLAVRVVCTQRWLLLTP